LRDSASVADEQLSSICVLIDSFERRRQHRAHFSITSSARGLTHVVVDVMIKDAAEERREIVSSMRDFSSQAIVARQ
jgi:hypothetical protein